MRVPLRRKGRGKEEDQSTYHQKAPRPFLVSAILIHSVLAFTSSRIEGSGEYFDHLHCEYPTGQHKVLFTFFVVTSGHEAEGAAARSSSIRVPIVSYENAFTYKNGLIDQRKAMANTAKR